MAYINASGLTIPTVEQLLENLSTEQRANIDPLLNTNADGPLGQLNGIFASHLREAWEVVKIAWDSRNPNNAEGQALEAVCAITGTTKRPASRSKLQGTRRIKLNVDPGAVVPELTEFEVTGSVPPIRFRTTERLEAVAGGDYYVAAESVDLGPVVCNANTLTTIPTPVVGLNSVTNQYDAIPGQLEATDAELRTDRERELRATGSGTVDAIRSDLLDYEQDDGTKPILEATIYENTGEMVDALGLPPKSLECLVYDGVAAAALDDGIAQTIWNSKPAGIQLVGSVSGNATDSTGAVHVVPFTRPTLVPIKIQASLVVDLLKFGGTTAARQALVDAVLARQKPTKKVRWSVYLDVLQDLAGVLGVGSINIQRVGLAYGTANTDLVMGPREQATLVIGDVSIATSTE